MFNFSLREITVAIEVACEIETVVREYHEINLDPLRYIETWSGCMIKCSGSGHMTQGTYNQESIDVKGELRHDKEVMSSLTNPSR